MVVAFEPDPFNAWLLDRNLIENGVENVIVSNAAVGAQSGNIRLHRYKSSNYGRHSLLTDLARAWCRSWASMKLSIGSGSPTGW